MKESAVTDGDRRRDLLTVAEVARVLRCGHRTVRAAIHDGRIPACRPLGEWRVRRADVEALIEATRVVPRSTLLSYTGEGRDHA